MEKSVVKFFDKIIVLLLGFSGVFSGCEKLPGGGMIAEYGMPHADFEIKGVVMDKVNSQPIQNIRVVRQVYENFGDTLYTDLEGKYAFEFSDYPILENPFHLKIEDIDGEENGGYFGSEEIDVKITQADQVKKGDGHWYDGKFVKTQNVELEREYVVPMYGPPSVTFNQ